jgi:hypothetical protein
MDPSHLSAWSGRCNGGDVPGRLIRTRQQNLKACTLARRADNVDRSAVTADDSLNGREPQAASGEFGREKRIKDPGLYLWRHAAARVGDFQLYVISRGRGGDADHSVPVRDGL